MKKNKEKIMAKKRQKMNRKRVKKIETNVIIEMTLTDKKCGVEMEVYEQAEKATGGFSFRVIDPAAFDSDHSKFTFCVNEDVVNDVDQFFNDFEKKGFARRLLNATLTIKSNVIRSINIHSVNKNLVVSDAIRNITKEV